MKMQLAIHSVLLSTVLLGGCVTDSHAVKLEEREGRIVFEQTQIAEAQADVMARLQNRFAGTPSCSSVKTGMVNSWKAMVMEECSIPLSEGELFYADVAVDAMNVRFIDGRLLQMEMVFASTEAEQSEIGSVSTQVSEHLLADIGLAVLETGDGYQSWTGSKDLVELQGGAAVSLKISDARLAKTVLALGGALGDE